MSDRHLDMVIVVSAIVIVVALAVLVTVGLSGMHTTHTGL
jgi:hypothetical protein